MSLRMLSVGLAAMAIAGSFAHPARAQDGDTGAATPPPTPLEQELALAKTRLELLQTQNAMREAAVAAVPASGIEAGVDVQEGAGKAEVTVLAARQLQTLASTIATGALADPPPETGRPIQWVLLSSGEGFPDLSDAEVFDIRVQGLTAVLMTAKASKDEVRRLTRPAPWQSQLFTSRIHGLEALMGAERGALALAGPIEAAATLVSGLQIAGSVLSYFASDFTVAGAPNSSLDSSALEVAVLQAGRGHIGMLQPDHIGSGVRTAFGTDLQALDTLRNEFEAERRICAEVRADMERKLAEKDANVAAIRADYAQRLDACAPIERAVAAHAAFATDYGGSAESSARAVKVLKQRSIRAQLVGRRLLLVDLNASGGSSYTQQNLFSQVGLMPFHITTASVASWRTFNDSAAFVAGGLVPAYDGYRRLQEVDTYINGCASVANRRRPSEDCRGTTAGSR